MQRRLVEGAGLAARSERDRQCDGRTQQPVRRLSPHAHCDLRSRFLPPKAWFAASVWIPWASVGRTHHS